MPTAGGRGFAPAHHWSGLRSSTRPWRPSERWPVSPHTPTRAASCCVFGSLYGPSSTSTRASLVAAAREVLRYPGRARRTPPRSGKLTPALRSPPHSTPRRVSTTSSTTTRSPELRSTTSSSKRWAGNRPGPSPRAATSWREPHSASCSGATGSPTARSDKQPDGDRGSPASPTPQPPSASSPAGRSTRSRPTATDL